MRRVVVFLLALILPSSLFAQKTEDELKARLVNKPLYLRGQWGADKLEFDSVGMLQGTSSAPVTFVQVGVDVHKVKLTPDRLVLEGQRVGLAFKKDVPKRVGLEIPTHLGGSAPEKMTIQIARPQNGDYAEALDNIFTEDLADFVPRLPKFWRDYGQKHLLPPGSIADATAPPTQTGTRKVGGGVTPPQILTSSEPEFSMSARAARYMGVVTISLIVDAAGKPSNLSIVHPTGMGLDEKAIDAVSKYTFVPAKENGAPVPVMLNVEVNFQIF